MEVLIAIVLLIRATILDTIINLVTALRAPEPTFLEKIFGSLPFFEKIFGRAPDPTITSTICDVVKVPGCSEEVLWALATAAFYIILSIINFFYHQHNISKIHFRVFDARSRFHFNDLKIDSLNPSFRFCEKIILQQSLSDKHLS